MEARKLSIVAGSIVIVACVACVNLPAQSAAESSPPTSPGTAGTASSTKYQNPFAGQSGPPPISAALRSGPRSRWHSQIPKDAKHQLLQPELVNGSQTPVVVAPAPVPAIHLAPSPGLGTAPPPATGLGSAEHGSIAAGEKSNASGEVLQIPIATRTTVPRDEPATDVFPLTQPRWIEANPGEPQPPDPAVLATLESSAPRPIHVEAPVAAGSNSELIAGAMRVPVPSSVLAEKQEASSPSGGAAPVRTPSAPLAEIETIISDCSDTPEGWLAEAQELATRAESLEELASVISLCERGLRGSSTVGAMTSLRRLSAWAHNRRGELHADSQRPEEALEDFHTAIALDPTCSSAIHNRAVSLAQHNQFAAALRDFNRVIELNPKLGIAYRNRAELLSALGRWEEAVEDYGQAIAAGQAEAGIYQARAHALHRLGNTAPALADLNQALEQAPDDPASLALRGDLLVMLGRYDQASSDYHRAIERDSRCVDAYRGLAWLLAVCPDHKVRDARAALAAAEQAVALSGPNDYRVLDTLAAAQASNGHYSEAAQAQQKALAAAPRELANSLQVRLSLYQRGQSFLLAPNSDAIRTVSHEAPVSPAASRPSPTARRLQDQ
ncbi:MAG: tetratricopeptide repeat protein [Pirellulales bacterium]|nr:tetratricopeptide repeat protein [Pirellulales bacterium]